ncbi:hypothetical protein D7V86_20885 [bacterium D16-51]|nr:hypothetical protein D7V96_22240 [bacterium D16-59]RKI55878.1 hypothetical protein D7V86_20885 [bacterium D16-51]
MKKALLLTGISWMDPLQRHQQFASYLSKLGYEVYFVEHIVSSKFSIKKVIQLFKTAKLNRTRPKNEIPSHVHLVNMGFINPGNGFFALVNFFKVIKMLKVYGKKYDLVINYLPINTTRFILNNIERKNTIYDCVRNFNGWGGYYKSIEKEEAYLSSIVNAIFCDSFYLKNKFRNAEVPVIQFFPIANDKWLEGCAIKKDIMKIKKIGYFGTIDKHIDINVFKLLINRGYEIHFWGVIECEVDLKLYRHGYVKDLGVLASQIIATVDAILLPYRGNMDGVIPAKMFQALSTKLPVFCSNFYDSRYLNKYIYVYNSKKELVELMSNYTLKQHMEKVKCIDEFLGGKDESNQFQKFKRAIE